MTAKSSQKTAKNTKTPSTPKTMPVIHTNRPLSQRKGMNAKLMVGSNPAITDHRTKPTSR